MCTDGMLYYEFPFVAFWMVMAVYWHVVIGLIVRFKSRDIAKYKYNYLRYGLLMILIMGISTIFFGAIISFIFYSLLWFNGLLYIITHPQSTRRMEYRFAILMIITLLISVPLFYTRRFITQEYGI